MTKIAEDEARAVRWFAPNVVYWGEGRAEFEDPAAVAVGPAEARFDEHGREHITMEVQSWETEEDLEDMVPMAVLGGLRPKKKDGVTRLTMDMGSRNRCISVSIDAEGGRFLARDPIYHANMADIMGIGPTTKLAFSLSKSAAFEPILPSAEATYWVLPLTNFVSEYSERVPVLDEHSLRLQPLEDPSPQASDQERTLARYNVQRVIPFMFAGQPGYIEPLPDHEARAKELKEGRLRETVTAVMVGCVPDGAAAAKLERWFPYDFLRLLSFATGSDVSGLWIELRAADGALVQRAHGRLGRPCFAPGHRVIREDIMRGTGKLLTAATKSEYWPKTELRVALRQSVLAGRHHQLLEERVGESSKGLDGLGSYFNIDVQAISKELPGIYLQPMEEAIRETCTRLRHLQARARRAGNPAAAAALKTIESRVANAANKPSSFGDVVAALLRRFDFPDADILEAHYGQLGRSRTWSKTLSDHRNIPAHGSYFASLGRPIDREEILALAFHLHDILIRQALRMLGYSGEYQPPVVRYVEPRPVDWVTSKTTAAQLGY